MFPSANRAKSNLKHVKNWFANQRRKTLKIIMSNED